MINIHTYLELNTDDQLNAEHSDLGSSWGDLNQAVEAFDETWSKALPQGLSVVKNTPISIRFMSKEPIKENRHIFLVLSFKNEEDKIQFNDRIRTITKE